MYDEPVLYYDVHTDIYGAPQKINIDEFCNGMVIKNSGTTLLIVDGETLNPGESKSFGGNRMEILVGRHELSFQTQVPPPATIINQAVVTSKVYVKPEFRPK
jgi:hypothetical protein